MSTKKFAVSLLTVSAAMLVMIPAAFAADSEAMEIAKINASSWKAIAAGLAIAIAAFGGALAQGRAAAAALEGIARNPSASGKLFTPMILGLALIESLVIYALLIAFMIKP